MILWTFMTWIRSTKKQIIVHLMKTGNWRVQKIAFLFMLKAALHSLYVRWWLTNVKCQRSNLVSNSSDQKLSVLPSLTRFGVSESLPILKFKLEREISWWQTHRLIILMITERTARLRLEVYSETGWSVMTFLLIPHENFKTLNALNAHAMKSSLFSRNVAWYFTSQTHLSKGNFPSSLDNTPRILRFSFRNKHGHPEQCSSKLPDLILTEMTITFFNLTSRTDVFFELSKLS